jgi:hypothetical protein
MGKGRTRPALWTSRGIGASIVVVGRSLAVPVERSSAHYASRSRRRKPFGEVLVLSVRPCLRPTRIIGLGHQIGRVADKQQRRECRPKLR